MHDIKSFHVEIAVLWNVNGCLCAIACAFRWGVTLVEKIQLIGIAHPIVGNNFRY